MDRDRHFYMTIYPSSLRFNSLELTDSGRDLNHWTGKDDQILKWWIQGAMNSDLAGGVSSLVQTHSIHFIWKWILHRFEMSENNAN